MAVEREINYKFSATENVTTVAGRVQKALKSARKSEGAEAIEEIAKLGRGAGKLLALELAGRALSAIGQTLQDVRRGATGATTSVSEYAEGWVKAIPILDDVYKGLYSIGGEISGIQAKIDKTQSASRIQDMIVGGRERTEDLGRTRRVLNERFLGQDLKARLIEIKGEREAAVRAIRHELDAANAQLPGPQHAAERQSLRDSAAEQAKELTRIQSAKEREAVEQDREQRQSRRFSLADKGIEFLRREVDLQKAGAATELGRLEIIQEFAKKRLELYELGRRENLSDDERALVRKLAAALPGQEADALKKFGIATPRFSGGVAPTQESYFSTGLAAAGRENDPEKRTAKATEEIVKLMRELAKKLLDNPVTTPNFIPK